MIYFQGSLGQPAGVRRAAAVSSGAGGLVASCTLLVHSVPCFNFVYYMVVNSGLSGLLCPLCLLHYGRALDTIYSPGGFLARCTSVLVRQHFGTLMAYILSLSATLQWEPLPLTALSVFVRLAVAFPALRLPAGAAAVCAVFLECCGVLNSKHVLVVFWCGCCCGCGAGRRF